jgi:hypothetical protein
MSSHDLESFDARFICLMPKSLKRAVGRAASKTYTRPSAWVREAIIEKLERERPRHHDTMLARASTEMMPQLDMPVLTAEMPVLTAEMPVLRR